VTKKLKLLEKEIQPTTNHTLN